jgi:hypothetical protein
MREHVDALEARIVLGVVFGRCAPRHELLEHAREREGALVGGLLVVPVVLDNAEVEDEVRIEIGLGVARRQSAGDEQHRVSLRMARFARQRRYPQGMSGSIDVSGGCCESKPVPGRRRFTVAY